MRTVFFFTFFTFAYAQIPLGISKAQYQSLFTNMETINTFNIQVFDNENSVYQAFANRTIKVAILRSDLLAKLYEKSRADKDLSYHIIGKLSTKSILYFGMKKQDSKSSSPLKHQRISIGLLGDRSNQYLKSFLRSPELIYSNNYISEDAYRTISDIRRNSIDGFLLFASDKYQNIASPYLKKYPEGFKNFLANQKGIYCGEHRYCTAFYYLIVSDSLNKSIMKNIYVHTNRLLVQNKALATNLGQYFIYTGKVKQHIKNLIKKVYRKVDKPKKDIFFHRAPWMDVAIHEAIKGKGSAENILPMLDLSYKYIRFAKGNRGITTAPNDNKEGSWCAAYICWTLDKAGYRIHKKGRMASQSFRYFNNKLYKKIEKPIFGAITVYTSMKNPAHGHVGYLFGKTKNGKYILLGGNQNNRLKFAAYPVQFGSYKLRGFYVPIDYKIKPEDMLTKKDIYFSAEELNRKYGINAGKQTHHVR